MLVLAAKRRGEDCCNALAEFYKSGVFDFHTIKIDETPLIKYILLKGKKMEGDSTQNILKVLCRSPQIFHDYSDFILSEGCNSKVFLNWLINEHGDQMTIEDFATIACRKDPALGRLWSILCEREAI